MQFAGILTETGEPATVTVSGSRIESVTPGLAPGAFGGSDVLMAPGLFDLQLNGYAGFDFNQGIWESADQATDTLSRLFDHIAQSGTALLLPTVVTNSFESMTSSLRAIDALLLAKPEYAAMAPGVHVEGPYISSEDGPRGAHPFQHIRDPDYGEFQRMQDAAGGRIRLFTLAPERHGALPFIEKLASQGITVAIGHTGASPEVIRDAVSAGAKMSTHLGNGAHSMLPRHPNYIWEQLACDELYASLITDGHHLPKAVVKSLVRAKGMNRIAIVSDAVSLGGLPPGLYSNGMHEVLPGGKIVLAGTPYLAGAGHLMDVCVANAVRFSDLTISEAVSCSTQIPAEILGLGASKGRLLPGYDGDLTLFRYIPTFPSPGILARRPIREDQARRTGRGRGWTISDGPLEIIATVSGGRIMYQAPGSNKEH